MTLSSSLLVLGIGLLWDGCGVTAQVNTYDAGAEEGCGGSFSCPNNTVCNKTSGAGECFCKPGFRSPTGIYSFKPPFGSCDDINECVEVNPKINCGSNAYCNNTPGGYGCLCVMGYLTASGKQAFSEKTEKGCKDIDECIQPGPAPCGPNATCHNTPGKYHCTCDKGFQSMSGNKTFMGTNESTCQDIDECKENPTLCSPYGKCINTRGDFMCKCHPGFGKSQKDPNKLCQDINECKNNSICGPNTVCTNIVRSYSCNCNNKSVPSTGFTDWTNETVCLEINCRNPSTSQSVNSCANTNDLLCELQGILESAEPTCGSFKAQENWSQETLQRLLNAVDDLLNRSEWTNEDAKTVTKRHQLATKMLDSIETTVKNVALILPQGKTILSNNGTYLQVWKSSDREENIATLGNSTQMRLNRNAAVGERDKGLAMAGLFSFRIMSTILSGANRIETAQNDESQPENVQYVVISDVVTAFVSNDQPYNLKMPIKFTFALAKEVDKHEVICSYRKLTGNTSSWSTEGCTKTNINAQNVTCECNHLSSFAVLMALYDFESWTLDIITKVGLAISLVCLLISIITFMFCRSLQGTRNTIHLHLCLSLFLAYAIFLAGITRVENKTACSIVAGLLHYFFLASFCWMCLEGVELYLMVVKVFKTNAMKKRYMVLAGYGAPLVIVGISVAVRSSGYGTEKHCWLSLEHGFIWSFLAPISVIILLNAVIFVITVWKLAQKFSTINPDIDQLKKIRTFTITAIAQLCLLGCTWIIGIFQIDQHTLFMSYLFTIFNCLQGTFIFVLHCLLKKQVRDEYRRWFCAAASLKTLSSYDKFSSSGAFSSSSSQTRALRPTKESGM